MVFTSLHDSQLILVLQHGAVGVLPTDTVYGLACSAGNSAAVERLYQLKLRERKPGTIIAANLPQLVELGFKRRYLKAVEQFWPGAVSIVIPCGEELAYLHQGLRSLAVRIPAHKPLQTLLSKTGPLLTSSANHPGQKPADTIDEARTYFDDHIDFYVDGGDLSGRSASTIIRVIDDAVEVIRQGAVIIDENGAIQS